jgi:predicted methyltransferase
MGVVVHNAANSGSGTPLLTSTVHEAMLAARRKGVAEIECSLDLGRSTTRVEIHAAEWVSQGRRYPYLEACKERTIYYWMGSAFESASRFGTSLIKLVPTEWGAPTFEIDGIKMLPTARVSPYEDAERKVALISPRGKTILDTCGGLGYFASWCLQAQARAVHSYEKNQDVLWLRGLNPWSPREDPALTLTHADVAVQIAALADASYDAVLHDPPRFGIAGELYSQAFYDHIARILKRGGKLFHYTGEPNKLTSGRDVPNEVATRLRRAGFATEPKMDGILATKLRAAR